MTFVAIGALRVRSIIILSQLHFLGKRLEGIWHTGIVVYGQEYYFGGTGGIECCPPVSIRAHPAISHCSHLLLKM